MLLNPLVNKDNWSLCFVKYKALNLLFFDNSTQHEPICVAPFYLMRNFKEKEKITFKFKISCKHICQINTKTSKFYLSFKDRSTFENFFSLSDWIQFSSSSFDNFSMSKKCGTFVESEEEIKDFL